MEKKKIVFKIINFFLLVLFFLTLLLLFGGNNTDNIWNYGVSHALRMGELPYRDYNSITTPLYQFIMSSGLFLYDSYLMFLVEQSILCSLLVVLLHKMVGKNVYFLLSLLLFPIFYFIFPNYNFLTLLLFVLVLYLEKEKKEDSWIGFVLGLLFLTKHSVGGITLIFGLLATRNLSKSIKRFVFFLVPNISFLLYLLFTKTFGDFLNLCIFGLFDFAGSNRYISFLYLGIAFGCFIYTIYSFLKKKDVLNYYLIPIFSFLLPIADMFHMVYFLGVFLIVWFYREPISKFCIPRIVGICVILGLIVCNSLTMMPIFQLTNSTDGKMKYVLVPKENRKYIQNVLEKYQSYDSVYMLSLESMYFDIESGHKITYFDIPLYGNFGYNGFNRMKKTIDEMHDTYVFVLDNVNRQYVNQLNDYVREKGTLQDTVEDYEIYYLE